MHAVERPRHPEDGGALVGEGVSPPQARSAAARNGVALLALFIPRWTNPTFRTQLAVAFCVLPRRRNRLAEPARAREPRDSLRSGSSLGRRFAGVGISRASAFVRARRAAMFAGGKGRVPSSDRWKRSRRRRRRRRFACV
jgi:hypothetical protein